MGQLATFDEAYDTEIIQQSLAGQEQSFNIVDLSPTHNQYLIDIYQASLKRYPYICS